MSLPQKQTPHTHTHKTFPRPPAGCPNREWAAIKSWWTKHAPVSCFSKHHHQNHLYSTTCSGAYAAAFETQNSGENINTHIHIQRHSQTASGQVEVGFSSWFVFLCWVYGVECDLRCQHTWWKTFRLAFWCCVRNAFRSRAQNIQWATACFLKCTNYTNIFISWTWHNLDLFKLWWDSLVNFGRVT